MATRRWILMLSAAATISLLAGCGGSTFNVQNPPPPPPSNVMIVWQPQPGTQLAVGFSMDLTAVVSNDPKNLGVSWSLSCQGGQGAACGTLSTYNTASGVSTTYTAPNSISGNTLLVQIVAEALADQTKNLVAPITITSFSSGLQAGNYVLEAQGNQNGNPYQFAGVITLDGQGNITGGEQTANSNGVSVSDTIVASGSSYFIGNDGRGTLTLNTGDNTIGGNGIETFVMVFLNNGPQNPQALISQIDFASGTTGVSAAGTLELQTGVAAPSGSYAFVLNGTDVLNGFPLAFGGVFNIPSGQTAISGVVDEVIGEKVKLSDGPFLTGSQVSSPDSLGKVTITLVGVVDGAHPKAVTALLAGYIVDASHIALVETDTDPASGVTALGMTGGIAIGQVSGDYGTFTDASLSGPYVFGVTGVDLWQSNLTPTTWTLAGITTADGQTNLTSGFIDSFLQLNCVQSTCKTGGITGGQISAQFTGTYAVDSASDNCGASSGTVVPGTGRACLTPATFTPAPNPTYSPELFFYLTGLTGPGDPAALVLGVGAVGPNPNLHYPSLGTGIAYVQSSAVATFSGTYGMSFTQEQNGSENDGTAQMTVNPNGTPQVSGVADSTAGTPDDPDDHSFTGSFATPLSTSGFAGSLFDATGNAGPFNVDPSNSNNGFSVDYFFIEAEHGFFVETDLINPNPGSGQVGFGYYTARTPVCQGCQ